MELVIDLSNTVRAEFGQAVEIALIVGALYPQDHRSADGGCDLAGGVVGVALGVGLAAAALNIMGLHSPSSAVLSAIIFNAIVIIALIPLALRGVRYRPLSASKMLGRNLGVYGLGGIVVPFVGIWLIDLVVRLIPGF